jgi:putative copper resistance protein D
MRHGEPLAAILCIVAAVMSLYAAASTMSGLPLAAAHQVFWITLEKTSVGRNCLSGLAVMVLIVLCTAVASRRWSNLALGVLLAAFAGCRAMSGHAAEHGVLSIAFAMEWLHLTLIAVWVGLVVMAAWIIVPRYRHAGWRHQGELKKYLDRLSTGATVALVGILLTGVYNVVLRVGSLANASGNPYSTALLVKGGMVFLALAIGAYNRFVGFPTVLSTGKVPRVVLFLLRAESFLLVGAVLAAVSLATMQPPSSV